MKLEIKLVGDWELASKILKAAPKKLKRAVDIASFQEASFLAAKIRERYAKGPHKPLSPLTLALRKLKGFRGSKPLVMSGTLAAAPTTVPAAPDGNGRYFIGIVRNAPVKAKGGAAGRNGAALVRLAEIHEFGTTVVMRMTDKMRRFLFGVLFKNAPSAGSFGGGSKGIIVIRIPARPVMQPVFDEQIPKSPERIANALAKMLPELAGDPKAFKDAMPAVNVTVSST